MTEAFRDHFGVQDGSPAAFARWSEEPDFDPDLLVVAFDGTDDVLFVGPWNVRHRHAEADDGLVQALAGWTRRGEMRWRAGIRWRLKLFQRDQRGGRGMEPSAKRFSISSSVSPTCFIT